MFIIIITVANNFVKMSDEHVPVPTYLKEHVPEKCTFAGFITSRIYY